jgi:proteasome lid subunit RPN8/RPN11
MDLRIPAAVWREIERELEESYPYEGCGLLAGSAGGEVAVAGHFPVRNRREGSEARRRYLIGPEDFLAAEQEARIRGLEIVGVYHSHPDAPAEPSEFDRENAWPWYCYLIVAVRCGRASEARAWQLRDDRSGFEERRVIFWEEQS